jgi:branched-chain amino acid transport system permease protein
LSAIPAGLVGAFYAHYIGAVSPDLFGFSLMALLLGMVWVGGVATVLGPMVAGVILTFASESMVSFGPWRLIATSVLIVVSIIFIPGGLWGVAARVATHGRVLVTSIFRRTAPANRGGS